MSDDQLPGFMDRRRRIDEAIAEYLGAGGLIDPQEWLERYPDLTLELLEFLENQKAIDLIVQPFRPESVPSPIHANCRIGNYQILCILNRGGMGVVYKAHRVDSDQIVALKMIQQERFASLEARARFQNEAETAARLNHTHIVAVHEVGEHNGIPFFAMDYIEGTTLSDLMRSGPLVPHRAADFVATIARAIHYAHTRGVLHRDLKPSNILLDREGKIHVTDFGLAKQTDRRYSVTESNQILGTLDYMSPEQAQPNHDLIGPASDVYSMGAVLYELLTGRPPFRHESIWETLRQIRNERPVPPGELNSNVPFPLQMICLKCLEKNPSRRYTSAENLAKDLESFLHTPSAVVEPHNNNRQPVLQQLRTPAAVKAKIRRRCSSVIPKLQRLGTPAAAMPALACALVALLIVAWVVFQKPPDGTLQLAKTTANEHIGRKGRLNRGPAPVDPNGPQNRKKTQERIKEVPPIKAPLHQDPENTHKHKNGTPFAVGKIVFRLKPDHGWDWHPDQPANIVSNTGLIQYPVFRYDADDNADPQRSAKFTVWFLLHGDKEPTVTVSAGDRLIESQLSLVFDADNGKHETLLKEWWQEFVRDPLPPASQELSFVDRYFKEMLARRLGFKAPAPLSSPDESSTLEKGFERAVEMLFGFISVRLAMMDSPADGDQLDLVPVPDEPANIPVTAIKPIANDLPTVSNIPPTENDFKVEQLAYHVPKECFYVRCGCIENYLWLRDTIQGWGGSLDEIVAVPSVDYRVRDKIELQLAFQPRSAMDAGIDDEITDCALIGLDTYFYDGAALGIVFESRTGSHLQALIKEQRRVIETETGATRNVLDIQGMPVELLSTGINNRVRSFYFSSGNYHFISNSKTLTRQLIALAQHAPGVEALGELDDYWHAHMQRDSDEEFKSVLYLSDPFFRNMTSPAYRIEVDRRRRAAHELRILQLARMATEAEGAQFNSLDALKKSGFLPEGFGTRSDGTRPVARLDAEYDSLRGALGTFLPIADVSSDLSMVTRTERNSYQQFKQAYLREWRAIDPVLVTFTRRNSQLESNPEGEHVVINIDITPYAQQEYRFLRQYLDKTPRSNRIALADDELLGISSALEAGFFDPQCHLGLIDADVEFEISDGEINRRGRHASQTFAARNSYALITPKVSENVLGLFQKLMASIQNNPTESDSQSSSERDVETMAWILNNVPILGLFRVNPHLLSDETLHKLAQAIEKQYVEHKFGRHLDHTSTLISQDPAIRPRIWQSARIEETERSSQIFMQMKDVSKARVYDYLQAYTFVSSRRLSAANAALLNRIAANLHLDPEQTRERVENVLGAKLTCPIGGEYELKLPPDPQQPRYWVSSMWEEPSYLLETSVNPDYKFEFLQWLKGMDLECTLTRRTLNARLDLEIADASVFWDGEGLGPIDRPQQNIDPRGPYLLQSGVLTNAQEGAVPHDVPGTSITNSTDQKLSYRWKETNSQWSRTYQVEPGQTHFWDLKVTTKVQYESPAAGPRSYMIGTSTHAEYRCHTLGAAPRIIPASPDVLQRIYAGYP